MRFGVLGPLAVWTDDGRPVPVPEAKVRALLADLLTHDGHPVSTDRLIEDLWGRRPPRNPANALQARVSQLRRALADAEPGGRELVVTQPPGYLLRLDGDAVDARGFRALAGRAAAAGDPRERAALLGEALALWRGPAYADFADEEFAASAAARLEEERLAAVEARAEARLDLGEHAVLAGELGELVARHPLRERLCAAHLRALYRAGRPSEALAAYAALRERLADELGLDPGPELVALHRAILRQDPALGPAPARRAPAAPPAPGPRSNLPASLVPLVGRAEAVAGIRALLAAERRLVTLTGPGGVGKTRLALAAARDPGGSASAEGAWLVELAGLPPAADGSPAAVAEAVASVLGIRDDTAPAPPGTVEDRLTAALRDRDPLLVLDNCEHVVGPVAALAEALLRAAPRLRILATSREPLGVAGERVWPVPPLALPGEDADPARAAGSPAVELFVARAADAVPGFALDRGNAAAVTAICRRLDGIPLALELAAARVRALGVQELAARLDDRFRVLTAGRRGAPARQQTLRAVIDWSWRLLSGPERVVLRRLGVHVDGFTLEAAEEVAAEDGVDVVDVLARLVDRSLVAAEPAAPGGGGVRYRLLESVRAYCLERLREAGESAALHERHARHHLGLAERAEPHLYGEGQREWLARLDRERANLRAAFAWAVRARDGDTAVRLAVALAWYWFLRGRLTEACRSLDEALGLRADPRAAVWRAGMALPAGYGADPVARAALAPYEEITDPRQRARALWFLSWTRRGFADLATTAELLDRALEDFREQRDRWGVAAALTLRATVGRARGQLARARRDAVEGEALFREAGDRWGLLRATNTRAELAEIDGDYALAARLHREGLRTAEELALWGEASFRLSGLGRLALLAGDLAAADDLHRRALQMAARQSDRVAEHFAEMGLALSARRRGEYELVDAHLTKWVPWLRGVDGEPGLALVLAELGFAAEQRGEAATALRLHRESLASARAVGDPRAVALALEGLAGGHALAGDPARAARLLGAAARLRDAVGAPLPEAERGDVDRIAAAARGALGEPAFTAEFTRGTPRDADEADGDDVTGVAEPPAR
ncbi:BTAD domain-containing putative transcriptional regulator [Streptomyces capparidis]